MGSEDEALISLSRAIQLEPCLWCAWWELSRLLCGEKYQNSKMGPSVEQRIQSLKISNHWMYKMFKAHLENELLSHQQSLVSVEDILITCPGNRFARTLKALTLYNMREFEEAAQLFEELWREEPHRISDMDVYSNILYVRGEKAKLSYLAHRVCKTDRYRPESCCIIGNYYSMRGSHAKAVSYFQRALKLNPSCLSAWTLMGHEFMELSNAVAAVNCYRRAVDINDRDFRAWYALGQAYEILGMDSYALWYFHKVFVFIPFFFFSFFFSISIGVCSAAE
jgi:anaphase-promoting complex subunit 8